MNIPLNEGNGANRVNESLLSKWYRKFDFIILRFEQTSVGLMLIFISLLAFVNVIARYFFGSNLNWAEELARYLMIWITFIGASLCVRTNEHVIMDMIIHRFPTGMYRFAKLAIGSIAAATSLYLLYLGTLYSYNVFQSGQFSPILHISMGWVYLSIPVGCLLMAKNFIEATIREFNERGLNQ